MLDIFIMPGEGEGGGHYRPLHPFSMLLQVFGLSCPGLVLTSPSQSPVQRCSAAEPGQRV